MMKTIKIVSIVAGVSIIGAGPVGAALADDKIDNLIAAGNDLAKIALTAATSGSTGPMMIDAATGEVRSIIWPVQETRKGTPSEVSSIGRAIYSSKPDWPEPAS